MKRIILTAVLFTTCLFADLPKAEESSAQIRQSVYFELFGNGLFYSLNYERFITPKLSIRIGGMVFPWSFVEKDYILKDKTSYIFPIMGNYLWGKGKHKLEAGAGAVILLESNGSNEKDASDFSNSVVRGTARLGYLYLPETKGWTFRFAYTPLITDKFFLHNMGLAAGYAF